MELVLANAAGSVRTQSWQGRDYFVAPMAIIVPGVLNGSNGPLFYPEDEVAANIGLWNGTPLVVNHPKEGGRYISAKDPAVLERCGVGYAFNDRFEGGRRLVDGWFDAERCKAVDKRVYDALKANRGLELSTGLSTTNTLTDGEHGGVAYNAIARQYKPDHVAVLPDSKGACSREDGCGVNPSLGKRIGKLVSWLVGNAYGDRSQNDKRDELQEAITKRFGQGAWVADVYDTYVVYQDSSGELFKLSYMEVDGECKLVDDEPQPVDRVTTYVPEVDVNKQGKVDHLIANCKCWEESDRATLTAMSEGKLDLLMAAVQPRTPVVQTFNAAEDPTIKALVASIGQLTTTVNQLTENQTAPRVEAAIVKLTANADEATKPALIVAYRKMPLVDLELLAANVKAPEAPRLEGVRPAFFGVEVLNSNAPETWKNDVLPLPTTFTPEELIANRIVPRSTATAPVTA